ncbi:hypothetical protein Tco_1025383 [Tanacetum coccineum]
MNSPCYTPTTPVTLSSLSLSRHRPTTPVTTNKSWTTLKNRTSSQFNDGLDAFLERCKDHLDEYNSATNEPPETKNKLEELLAKAGGKLYPGCDKSTLHYLSKLLHIKVLSKWTDSLFDMLLKFLKTKAVWLYGFHECLKINTLFAAKVCLAAVKLVAKHPFCCKKKELQDAPKSSQESGENVPEKEVMKKVLDKTPVVGKEDEEYEESDDKEMKFLDEHEEINDGDDYVE